MIARCRITRIVLLSTLTALLSCLDLRAQDRMPPLTADKMTDAQKKAAADYAAARNAPLAAGPFGVMLRVPELMDLAFKWRQHVSERSVIGPRLTEFAILITARHWTQQYEWNGHYAAAIKSGLKPETIAAVAEGRRPAHMADDETAVYDLLTELQRNHSVSDATYARALAMFGEAGVVETTSLAGYYAMLAMVMNTARTPLPAGATLPLAAFPH
jgi:4-carboxymuconolactone decarboxylase